MTYDLYIGDRTFSSWSLRGWLMLDAFDLPYRTHLLGLYAGTYRDELAALAPARTLPALRTAQDGILTDSLAMAETLAEAHPDRAFYPADPRARALARSMVCEMHSGFAALRDACPMMLAHGWAGFEASEAVRADLARIEDLWTRARTMAGDGPWLFGAYSLADVFYAPVATRIATYGLPVGPQAQAYVAQTLADPRLRRWRALGLTQRYDPMPYRMDLAQVPWPGPAPLPARPIETGQPLNTTCPFSGDPVTHLAEIDGHLIGFCNPTCRDKSVADPAAWPEVLSLLASPGPR